MSGYQGNEPFNDFIETVHIGTRFRNIFSPDVILTYDSRTRSFDIKYGEILEYRKDGSGTITLAVKSKGGSMYIITRIKGVYSAYSWWTWLSTGRAYIR